MPKNREANPEDNDLLRRELDCAVLNMMNTMMDKENSDMVYYHTVRGVFVEGEPVFKDSCIHEKTHVQVAVRNPSCIVGYFRPNLDWSKE